MAVTPPEERSGLALGEYEAQRRKLEVQRHVEYLDYMQRQVGFWGWKDLML